MKKTFFLVPLLLCLALFGDSRPGVAVSLGPVSADLIDHLEREGWQTVTSGVMQRTLDGDKVETLGFGAEGLRSQLQEMKAHLAFLREEYASQPSPELRRVIRAHRAAILRVQAASRKADAFEGLESSRQALVAAGGNCPVSYDAAVDAFPVAQGPNAHASSFFNNDCGYTGEVYAHAYARATNASAAVSIMTKSDPAPDTPRMGGNVSASASVGVSGVKDCYSYSYASVTNYDLGITYSLSDTNVACSGSAGVRPFAADAPSNVALPASPPLDPNGSAMVANLNGSNWHDANLYRYGIPVFDASAGTPRTIVCTESPACGLSQQPVPVNGAWKPSSGSNAAFSVIDYTNRKIYDFYHVATDADGTVKINSDGTVSTGSGSVADLDGDGRSPGSRANLSDLFGLVRVFEMERAASDPANAIQHALAVNSQYACGTYRYPATKSNGTSTSAGCIPPGSRLFLESSTDCSTVSPVGDKAVCYALKKYGAYVKGYSGSQFAVVFEVPTYGQPGGSGPDPYPGVGISGEPYNLSGIPWSKLKVAADCRCGSSDLTSTGGHPFAPQASSNVPLPASRSLDPNNSAIVANLNSSKHKARLYDFGKPVFNASAGTPRRIVCTEPWGTCDLSLQPVPVHGSWKPSSGTNSTLTVVDYTNRKVYDFFRVATDADGTVKINSDGTVSTGWGRVADLDGSGQVLDSVLSDLFGLVRVFEMERAASDPANAIQHALAITSSYTCSSNWRYPATQSNGTFSGTGCIPAGSRVFLDSTADCSTVSGAGEKAVCHALKKYGAYVVGTADSTFNVVFEVPTYGQPGGSGPDPYPGVGFSWDYYDMASIPWSRLKVAKDCQCTPY
jgi:hypothetical protein